MRGTLNLWLLLVALLPFAGCGAGRGNGTQFSSPGSTPIQITVSDSPADQVLSAQVTINSIALTTNSNATVRMLPSATTVELSHLLATAQPVAMVDVAQGTYTNASITLSNIVLNFVDGSSVLQQFVFPGPFTASFSFPATIASNPGVFNLDINLAQSLTSFSPGGFTPSVSAVLTGVPAFNQQEEGTGAIHDLTGTITSTGTSGFTVAVNQASTSLAILVDTNTQFAGVTGLADLTAGMIVEVNALMPGNGTLLATKVEGETGVKMVAEGVVVGGTPGTPNRFQIVVQQQAGTNAPPIGALLPVSTDNTTTFVLPTDEVSLSGLPFTPTFSGFANLAVGQTVQVRTTSDFTAVAAEVKLAPRAMSGSPITQNGSQFTLGLPPTGSALNFMTGASSVDFIVQPATEFKGMTGIILGSPVRVRGLMFFDIPSSRYKLVASRITPGP